MGPTSQSDKAEPVSIDSQDQKRLQLSFLLPTRDCPIRLCPVLHLPRLLCSSWTVKFQDKRACWNPWISRTNSWQVGEHEGGEQGGKGACLLQLYLVLRRPYASSEARKDDRFLVPIFLLFISPQQLLSPTATS